MILDIERLSTVRRRRPHEAGGEWDYLRALPPRTRRRLTGAGLLGTRYGVAPDQLAEEINNYLGTDLGECDAIRLWAREAIYSLDAAQRAARRRREQRRALQAGCRSWWEYRAALYRERGAGSVHEYAIAQGWRS